MCDEQLTVHYADGSTDVLTADTWSQYYKDLPKGQNTDLRQTDGIPVFQFNHFDPSFLEETNDAAAQMSNAEISMLDMRSNVGATRKLRISGSTDTATNGYLALEFVIPFFLLLLSLHLSPQKRPAQAMTTF